MHNIILDEKIYILDCVHRWSAYKATGIQGSLYYFTSANDLTVDPKQVFAYH